MGYGDESSGGGGRLFSPIRTAVLVKREQKKRARVSSGESAGMDQINWNSRCNERLPRDRSVDVRFGSSESSARFEAFDPATSLLVTTLAR